MSITAIFTRAQPSIGGYVFDALLEESTELPTEVTEFPVESGALGNDHVVQRPLKITMTVGVSDNPFRAVISNAGSLSALAGIGLGNAAGRLIGEIGELAAAAGLTASIVNAAFAAGQAVTRSQNAIEAIREIQRAAAIIDVVSLKKEYKSCVITNTYQQTTKENEQAVELVVELSQLLIVSSRVDRNRIPAPNDTAETQAQEEINLGQLVAQE